LYSSSGAIVSEERAAEILTGCRTIVLVDDVMTSGATALAAYMALGDPQLFEVWTIANRPKLATMKAF
jgi:predicted amidophosphoribosyltransferase